MSYPGYPHQNPPIIPPLPDLPNSSGSQVPNAWFPGTPAMGFTQQYPTIPPLPPQNLTYPYSPYPPQPPHGLPYPTSPYATPAYPPNPEPSYSPIEFPPLPPLDSEVKPEDPQPEIEPWFDPVDDVTEEPSNPEAAVEPEDDVEELTDQFSDILNAYNDDIVRPAVTTEPTPTIFPADPFDAGADAAVLRKAMKGLGTNERAVVDVLSRRTNQQRMEIAEHYRTTFGKDLVRELRSELSGKLLALVVAAMTPLPALYARELHDAMAGSGSEVTLVELLCTLSNSQLRAVAAQYETMFKGGLEEAMRAHTAGLAQRLLLGVCAAERDEDAEVDVEAAEEEASQLLTAGEGPLDEDTFVHVLTSRSLPHVRHVLAQYEQTSGNPLEQVVKRELSGSTQRVVLAIVKCVRSRAEFLAELVHASVAGLGTKDRALIRLVVTRAELDLGDVKTAFQLKYGKSMAACVARDTSGDYKKMLLAMIA